MSILDDVPDPAIVETNQMDIRRAQFRPRKLLHTIEAMFGPDIAGKKLSLQTEIPENPSNVLIGDRKR